MIYLHRARMVVLSQQKTGTTALEKALTPRAAMVVSSPPEMKHVAYGEFLRLVAPYIEEMAGLKRSDYLVVTVMREPLDWLGSWYRYRTRNELADPSNPRAMNYTGNISFTEFVREVCRTDGETRPFARIDRPSRVARADDGRIGVDRLFPYEDLQGLYALISERIGKPVETQKLNVSPEMTLQLGDAERDMVRRHFADDFALHASLRRDGMVDHRFR